MGRFAKPLSHHPTTTPLPPHHHPSPPLITRSKLRRLALPGLAALMVGVLVLAAAMLVASDSEPALAQTATPEGVVWQAQMTPGVWPGAAHLTGWSRSGSDNYGTLPDSQRTFTENTATFTVNWLFHDSNESHVRFRMSRSERVTFAAATLCAGSVSGPIPIQTAPESGSTEINIDITDPSITATPPWTIGTPVAVGIVRSPATCADLAPPPAPPSIVDYDVDNDRLIEVGNLAQLNAIRWDLDGDGTPAIVNAADYEAAFPNGLSGMGCPTGCQGYEFIANLDFDTNGNGMADEGDAYWNDGAGWEPIGTNDAPLALKIDGNLMPVSNLYINRPTESQIGLFGRADGPADFDEREAKIKRIERVSLVDVNITGNGDVGGLVGIVEFVSFSYASGAVTGHQAHAASTGGVYGHVTDTPTSVYYDSSTSTQTRGGTGYTTAQLQAPTGYTGIYSGWNVGDTGAGTSNYWDFGTSSDYPRLRLGAFGFDLDSTDVCELSVFQGQQTARAARTCWQLSSGGKGHYAVSGAPAWLEAAPGSDGALSVMNAIGFNTTHALTLRPSAAALQLEPGTYQATLTILNTGSRGRDKRTVSLTVKPEAAAATGILWQAQITPSESSTIPGITGWVEDAYGSMNGGEPFLDRGAIFTVRWVSHRGVSPQMRLGLQRSAEAAFDAATLCVGGLSVPIPAQAAADTLIALEMTGGAITGTRPWTLGTPVTVGIVRAPAACADLAPAASGGIVWQAEMNPALHSDPVHAHITGWSSLGSTYGSLNDSERTFTDGGVEFTVQWVAHNSNTRAMLLNISRASEAAFGAATLCAGDLSVRIPAQNPVVSDINLEISAAEVGTTPPWTVDTPVTVGIVRAPTTCAALPPPTGVLWQAEITPADGTVLGVTGWQAGSYGSINGGQTFTESDATFTVTRVAHNRGTQRMWLRMSRSSSAAFGAATLCVGDLPVPIPAQTAGTGAVDLAITDPGVSAIPPWTIGTPVTVGIVRGSTTCAALAAPPPSVPTITDTLSARISAQGLEDDGRLYFETGETITVRARVTAPAGTSYRWAALTREEEPQEELTLSGTTSGDFTSRVAGRTINVVLHAPEAGPDFYNLFLLRLTLGDLVVDTDVVVTRAEPAGRAARMFADAGEDRTVTVGTRVTLQGRAGPKDARLSTYWKQIGGRLLGRDQGFKPEFSGDFLLFNQGSLRPNFIAPDRPDRIVLRLEVEDEYGNRATDTVTITVVEEETPDTTPPKPIPQPKRPPNVPERPVPPSDSSLLMGVTAQTVAGCAGKDMVVKRGETVTLGGDCQFWGGLAVRYYWHRVERLGWASLQIDGRPDIRSPGEPNPQVYVAKNAPVGESNTFRLTIVDQYGGRATDDVTVTVAAS